ncbi:hypothetical protein [Rathayibacter sp. SD072]|uniref:Cap15 family cyclic dinucleotide receptor domain-containing protein n=1 Tax=Rathayibacter sp. SD072 TaxID=2781731 RepID=UPI001A9568E3|nr:hypothetical protein [Rathayibacter sp. SD072]
MMVNGILLRVIIIIVSTVFVAAVWVTTGKFEPSFLQFFSIAVLVCSVLLFVWDRWAWKLKLAQAIPGVSRNIDGTWEATLESLWIDPMTGESPDPKTVYVVIKQTSTSATVALISNESKSKSSIARLVREDGSWLLHYLYTNEPDMGLRERSPIHHGSGVLAVVGSPAKRIVGSYWTDRDSKGKLSLQRRKATHAEDFEEGVELFSASR